MQSDASTPKAYIDALPEERKFAMKKLRAVIRKHLPKGFQECMNYGMLGYVVPHKLFPAGYHCKPETPLPFINLASQKNYIALYHLGLYSDPKLLAWFQTAYADRVAGKLDMGKSCIRFKKYDQVPYDLVGELCTKMSVQEWIDVYQSART